jgi:hypothetical protein
LLESIISCVEEANASINTERGANEEIDLDTVELDILNEEGAAVVQTRLESADEDVVEEDKEAPVIATSSKQEKVSADLERDKALKKMGKFNIIIVYFSKV